MVRSLELTWFAGTDEVYLEDARHAVPNTEVPLRRATI
jgi:hypothetical protein